MKAAYPVVFTKLDDGYMAFIPDFEINTQGDNLPEAINMARDAIGVMGIDKQDEGEPLPEPSPIANIKHENGDIVSMVDIDFSAYRRAVENRTVRKNVTLPSWLNDLAEKNDVNFSAVLQEGLKQHLHVQDR